MPEAALRCLPPREAVAIGDGKLAIVQHAMNGRHGRIVPSDFLEGVLGLTT
jgi:hypothetical protein